MATKTETFTLMGDTYRITQLGATVGSDLWDEILAAVSPTLLGKLEALIPKMSEAKGEQALIAMMAPAVLGVLSAIPKDLKKRWRKLFLENTELVTGSVNLNMAKAELFDQHFAGRYDAMTAWEAACLKHNFLGFLGSKPKSESSEPGAAK